MDVAEDKLRNGCRAVEALQVENPAFAVWFTPPVEMWGNVKKIQKPN